ncbi:MAG: isoprenylcysteine carboxylmethyltransferase family protein [Melioribacteraceae bacterium]|nr:isoprenylcysteine carboxylmethyltransferase family protein [Melioribacteraceae bacterium]MCF8353506.1 isoprenylcysteine carboxylmethyltransferase family protein [Melioribacteraceae bacterium]MCF8392635.1 isoprenylcysteine carboxylmethyltransferase family protein [Melioribacteraceae bacterium]MCF8418493.1 isoprenylcysteine carboxylmethyltransferase family protein [Melioribacteraceae bacterium]
MEKLFFKYRSYTPIPFLIVMIAFQNVTLWSLILGFTVALIGELIRFWGVAYAGSETRTTSEAGGTYLVISGAFGYMRNPLYFGNIMLYLGIGIMSFALFPYLQIGALIFFYIQYRFIINGEEKYLRETFGEEYKKYTESVPRFFPRFTSYKNEKVVQPPLNVKAGLKSERRSLQAFSAVTIILIIFYIVKVIE